MSLMVSTDLNTSYVDIKQIFYVLEYVSKKNLNTSYVDIKQIPMIS